MTPRPAPGADARHGIGGSPADVAQVADQVLDEGARSPALEMPRDLLAELLPFLGESVMVVREGWEVAANLTPPGGITGRPRMPGTHAMTNLHPDDALRLFDIGTEAFRTDPGWTGTTSARIQQPDGTFERYEVVIHNRRDHPVIRGMVVCTRRWVGAGDASAGLPGIRADALVDLLPVGVVVVSPTGKAVFANAVAAELLGTEVEPLCAGLLVDALAEVDRPALSSTIRELAAGPARRRLELAANDEGRLLELDLVSGEPADEVGVQLVIVTIADVTHRNTREQQLEHRANHDGLTGLANRAWLLDHLHERIERSDPLVLAFIDLDRFKAVNDRLGHVAGDAVLAAVGAGLEGCLHPGEVAARVGGDEFVIVSSGLDDDALADFDQRIRLAVATVPAARRQRVGVSVGLARSVEGDEPWALLRRADSAMYDEKRRLAVAPPAP